MSYSCYWDEDQKRWCGDEVIAYCEHPDCNKEITRGESAICRGCGLFFCDEHVSFFSQECRICLENAPDECNFFEQKEQEHPEWIAHCKKIGQRIGGVYD